MNNSETLQNLLSPEHAYYAAQAGVVFSLIFFVMLFLALMSTFSNEGTSELLNITPPVVSTTPDINAIPTWHLFGGTHHNTPLTALQLSLIGVFVSDPPDHSYAIIAKPDGTQQLYHIGDTLPGNAVLNEIFNDTVIISRDDQTERLDLPQHPLIFSSPGPGLW